jgi:hypothetical protein
MAEMVGLRAALGLIAVAGLCVFALSWSLEEDGKEAVQS